ncbi:MAG TPA: helix-hairpin-helix domain-containing protein, partial [Thermoplasmata archaeon]|nr:helix-hairpin-helix domain-containing protein [Thermoplasmata archaeon]
MKRRVADLPACKKCEGRYVPLILCDTCGGASVLRDLREIDDRFPCPDCSSENVTQVLCERCHDRKPLASLAAAAAPKARRPSVCPSCATFLGPKDRKCPTCGHVFEGGPRAERVKARRTRRIRGDLDAIQSQELQRIPGVTPDRVHVLAHAGYVAPWKLRRATEADLGAIPEIGPDGAREIMEALQALPESARRSSREPASPDEEFECPLCSCLTSGFSVSCRDCRAAFEEEEMDEAARANLIRDGDQGLLAFYDLRLMDEADDEDLWYARGILL